MKSWRTNNLLDSINLREAEERDIHSEIEEGDLYEGQLPPELCLLTMKKELSSRQKRGIPLCRKVAKDASSFLQAEIEKLGFEDYLSAGPSRILCYIDTQYAFYYQGNFYRFIVPTQCVFKTDNFFDIRDLNLKDRVYDATSDLSKKFFLDMSPKLAKMDINEGNNLWEVTLFSKDEYQNSEGREILDSTFRAKKIALKCIKKIQNDPSRIEDYLV